MIVVQVKVEFRQIVRNVRGQILSQPTLDSCFSLNDWQRRRLKRVERHDTYFCGHFSIEVGQSKVQVVRDLESQRNRHAVLPI